MLSLDMIRRDPAFVMAGLAKRDADLSLDRILELDTRRRQLISEVDSLRAIRNEESKRIGQLMRGGPETTDEAEAAKNRVREVNEKLEAVEEESKAVEASLNDELLWLPNLPIEDVPVGLDEEANVVARVEGEEFTLPFPAVPHWDLAETLDIIDFQTGASLSGSRFYMLKGAGARLQRALITWMLDVHTQEHGYTEIYPPYLVRREALLGSGNLPKFGDNLYHDEEDDLWLIPTAEVPLTGMHAGQILEPGILPRYYTAATPCFRREKAAAGRDTRGIKRVHQFDKVEMYKFVAPEDSDEELRKLMGDAEDLLRRLGLTYRLLELCTGDMGFPSAKSFDFEVWSPGCAEWLEVSSCSNCTDFQARRSNIRFRRERGGRPEFVHTLNGSGLAIPRIMIAILETYQQADGSVEIPAVLQPYTGYSRLEPAK
ncbi:MAG: seryl-tRNA synthetase [Chloroflexi bacterium]|jgi:seryl-tRNA synthetase|nr:MAG: seryl-tRNA synthetase [Chloroflexota bacterium]